VPLFTGEDVRNFHEVVRRVPIADDVVRYAVRLSSASRPGQENTPGFIKDWVSWGAGTRAAQYMVLGAKARALLSGRHLATVEDVRAVVYPVLRHRVLVSYRAEAEGITVEQVIHRLLEHVPLPKPA
jgi:MoxR-like ATPase